MAYTGTGVSGSFCPWRSGVRCSRATLATPALFQPMPSTPSIPLLSAHEAKEQLREIVEGFFFWRRNEQGQPPGRHLLVRSPPGLGKTRQAMEWATRYQCEQGAKSSILQMYRDDITGAGVRAQVAIFVPRHELARAVKEVIGA